MAHETPCQRGWKRNSLEQVQCGFCIQWMRVVFNAYSYIVYVHLWTLNAPGYNGFSFLCLVWIFFWKEKKHKLQSRQCVYVNDVWCALCTQYTASSSYSFSQCIFFMLGSICSIVRLHTCIAILCATLSASAFFSTIFYFNFVPFL